MLDIYKASAGSGKTFALTLAYFRIIFETPLEYKHILAVTFTNKATEEMKSRIINELHRLAEGKKSDYGEILKRELALNDDQLRNKAILLRNLLLHDYSRLSVTTIDRFFQRILKSFTRELGIFPNYNIELDSEFVLLKAIDKMLQQLKEHPELRNWINDLMHNQVEVGKSWNIKSKIAELGEELFKESYMLLDQQILQKLENKEFLKNYRNFLLQLVKEYEKQLTEIATEAIQLILHAQLDLADFKNGKKGCASWFYRLQAGEFEAPTPTVRKGIEDPEYWIAKSSTRKSDIESIRPDLMRCLQKALHIYDSNYHQYLSAKQLMENLYQLGILHDLYREIRNYCDEKDLMLLSDTTSILNQLIANNDTSFLFEKFGNYYNHLMIDEFQDTSSMQWKNFRPLVINSLGEGAKAMIVGDVKQSIYRWRNGEWGLLANGVEEEFQHLGVNQVVLKDNWRSAREIVEFNNDFFEKASNLLAGLFHAEAGEDEKRSKQIVEAYQEVKQTPKKQKNGYVDILFGPEKKEEQSEMAILKESVAVLEDIVRRGGKAKEAVILVRNGREGALVANYLMEYNKTAIHPIQFISNDSLYVSSSPYIQFLVAILRYIIEPYDLVNKATVLYIFHTFIREESKIESDELFRQVHEKELFSLLEDVGRWENGISSYSLYETIETIIDRLDLKKNTKEVPYLIAFQDLIYEYELSNANSITLFLEWWEKEQNKRVLTTSEEVDAVKILTIHKSKGLEFEYVILPFCSWELDSVRPARWLWCTNRMEGFDALEHAPLTYSAKLADSIYREDYLDEHLKAYIDNLNLLYVAMTRAKTELYLRPYAPHIKKDGSISLNDMGGLVCRVLEEMGVKWQENLPFAIGTKQMFSEMVTLSSNTLSLDHYPIWSPQDRIQVKYRFKDYLDSEANELSAIDEGKLLHEIFKSIRTKEEVEQAVQQAYLNGMIAREERSEMCAKIEGYLKNIEAAKWFAPECRVLNEKDILFPSGQKIRPDRVILLPDGSIQVIDYKFGQNVESKYLKQVAFYCSTLKKMGYSCVEGFVWYVKLGKIVSV